MGGRRRRRGKKGHKAGGRGLPLAGLLSAAAGPIISEIISDIPKPLAKKFIGGRRRRR